MGRRLFKELERSYGFDEVAIVPGQVTINPELTSTKMTIGDLEFEIPIMASAMDGAVSPRFAARMHEMGGLAVLNGEGLYSRYDDPYTVLEDIIATPQEEVTEFLQQVYTEPVKEDLLAAQVHEIKKSGAVCAVSFTPQTTKRMSPAAVEAGADIVVVQSTVTTARHVSNSYRGLIFSELIETIKVPVVVGNCVSYDVALELMETGIDGVLVGVGPGAACTTREVVGVGVPQVSATLECAAARQDYFRKTGRYVSVITDGGIRTGGDICKSIVSGADGVMLGTPFAQAEEAPGRGFNWGMANPHPELPRGTRVKVGTKAPLKQILYGPTSRTDGTQNFVGALKAGMGMCGAYTIRDLHKAEMVIAPAIKTEGKFFQMGG
ncbi:MAG: GuaB3 family IMP dehydrogenase-related protein [Chloroflexi bacterium]|nr:GuaB3 family IMP dehydrogenase-related protein [Chloroflexota bacterium]MYE41115.1 GuaB3 family IMP dehydrogenase-related protein [Chloroflexota bacterium]